MNENHQSLQDSLTAPYSPSKTARPLQGAPLPRPPLIKTPSNFAAVATEPEPQTAPPAEMAETETTSNEGQKRAFFPILALSLAGNLFTVGLLQFLFSEGGVLRLQWDASYWFVYCIAALPLFFLGLKKANSL